MKVTALVVTYNRKELLQECLNAILSQSRRPDMIVVLDNASTDGTDALFSAGNIYNLPLIQYIRSATNTGGAGGFYQGVKYARNDADWIWLMDDDTIPTKDALQGLLESLEKVKQTEPVSFLASEVIGPCGEAMNLPTIDMRPSENGYPDWYLNLHNKMVAIKTATFVSLLINCEAISKVGLPLSWYFIWGDDTEYTLRLTKNYGKAYFTGNSVVIHKRFNARQLSIWEDDSEGRIKNYYYFYRNLLLNAEKYESKKKAISMAFKLIGKATIKRFDTKIEFAGSKSSVVVKAAVDYLLRRYSTKQVDEK